MVTSTLTIALSLSFLASFHGKIHASDSNLSKAWQLFSKGDDLYTENKFDLALRYYFAALDLSPSMSKAYYRIGIIYGPLRRKYKKAIEFFHKSIKFDFQDPNAYHGLGITYCMAGDEHLGSKFLLKAGMIWYHQGKPSGATISFSISPIFCLVFRCTEIPMSKEKMINSRRARSI